MAEDTTTDSGAPVESGVNEPQLINGVAVDEQGQAIPVPEESEASDAAAEATSEESQVIEEAEATTGAEEPAQPEVSERLRKYAENQGFELDSPNAIKAAEIAMKNQSDRSREYQESKELEKVSNITDEQLPVDITPEQRDNVRVRNLELKYDIQQWRMSNPDKATQESAMVEVLADPTKRSLVQEGLLTLDDVYNLARANNADDLKAQGKREAFEQLKTNQQAAVPRGSAVTSSPKSEDTITPQNVDQLVAQHDLAWFQKNQQAINRAMAG